jgi:hypothetical protein
MKACPTCNRTYADETLAFCLVDGAILSAPYDSHETLRIPASRSTNPTQTEILNPLPGSSDLRVPSLSTIQAPQPTPLYSAKHQPPFKENHNGKPRAAIFIGIGGLVLILTAGVVLSLIWLVKDRAADGQPETKVPNTNVMPAATPTATVVAGGWGPRNDTASLTGENLTYYPGTTPEQCQADCAQNERCKGFTFIRAGAYNPHDSAMCYQLSVVKEMVSHTCCISVVKR